MNIEVFWINTSAMGRIYKLQKKIPSINIIVDKVLLNNFHQISNEEELSYYRNAYNKPWKQSPLPRLTAPYYYIQHPKKPTYLIETNKFFEYIFNEQINEIVDYIASKLKIRYLKIDIISGSKFDAEIETEVKNNSFKAGAKSKIFNSNSIELNFENGIIDGLQDNEFYWINEFPQVIDLVKRFNGGQAERFVETDNSFGISFTAGKVLGLNIENAKNIKLNIVIKS